MNYKETNRKLWNSKTDIHINSEFYDNTSFIKGRNSLNSIELELLGDIKGKSILHLQCHFGQDTISLSRLGANATGIDLSDRGIKKAKELATTTKSGAAFICCDIYDLPQYLDEEFDLVFTSYGTIGWLPDLNKWAKIVSRFLKPNGKFVFVEFHPVVWMFDNDFKKIEYNYFNTGPIVEKEEGTYTDKNAPISHESVGWNHSIGEVVNSLLKNGLEINSMMEFDYSPYDCFNETVEFAPQKFRIKHLDNKIPMVYSISASKK
ncbi:MAG: class I SAM-dependent methyltransferase [Melioribacteraceae bacterium]|nr:class I SAM-dependent methyltransferase [Melioribacteraceae bacterium]